MRRIETESDLRACWKTISAQLRRDLAAMSRLMHDPLGALQALGWEVSPAAAAALLRALP